MDEYDTPDMLRLPLTSTVLRLKVASEGDDICVLCLVGLVDSLLNFLPVPKNNCVGTRRGFQLGHARGRGPRQGEGNA